MIMGNKNNSLSSSIWNMNTLFFILFSALLIVNNNTIYAQENHTITHEDSLALENVLVEKYYTSRPAEYSDTATDALPKGAITYRIFIDMKPGYSLQAVYGTQKHELYMKTSTTFFNDKVCFAETGFNIDAKQLHKGNVALDSWITMGAASRLHTGIPLSEDDSSFSFITNRYPLSKVDGLTKGVLPKFQIYNIDLKFFNNDSTASNFSTFDGAWAAMGGVIGPTPENRVLIAQLTTNGKLSYGLNIQIGTPTGGYIQFVAKDPEGSEIQFNGLTNN
jgi:hypothetical protein